MVRTEKFFFFSIRRYSDRARSYRNSEMENNMSLQFWVVLKTLEYSNISCDKWIIIIFVLRGNGQKWHADT